jgi:hypothetical protein
MRGLTSRNTRSTTTPIPIGAARMIARSCASLSRRTSCARLCSLRSVTTTLNVVAEPADRVANASSNGSVVPSVARPLSSPLLQPLRAACSSARSAGRPDGSTKVSSDEPATRSAAIRKISAKRRLPYRMSASAESTATPSLMRSTSARQVSGDDRTACASADATSRGAPSPLAVRPVMRFSRLGRCNRSPAGEGPPGFNGCGAFRVRLRDGRTAVAALFGASQS